MQSLRAGPDPRRFCRPHKSRRRGDDCRGHQAGLLDPHRDPPPQQHAELSPMPTIYDRLGVRPIINACGPNTRLGGAIMAEPVVQAMVEASRHCVDMFELQARASAVIAEITGAEAGLVTSAAAAALLIGLAACITGLDPTKMNRLPDTTGMRNQVILARSQRNFCDRAIRSLGVEGIEVGLSDRFSDTGVRGTAAREIAPAITERTAAVYYLAKPHSLPPRAEVAAVAPGRR